MSVAFSIVFRLAAAAPSLVYDFGSAAVNGTATSATITISLTGLTAAPTVSIGGVDFTSGAISCNGAFTSCNATVTFSPKSPGLRQDALVLENSSGSLVGSAFLHGIGTAPLLRILPASITALAGNATGGYVDGAASSASFRNPQGLAADLYGNIYVADSVNQVIRKIAAGTNVVSTVAGNGNAGYSGDGGAARSATMNTPTGVAVDASGNLFIADQGNSLIRRVDAIRGVITTVAGGGSLAGDGIVATSASLSGPNDVAVDTAGNIYIADSYNNLIRKVTVATGLITTVAGGGISPGTDGLGDGGAATAAELSGPTGITLDSSGNLYIADSGNSMVRMVAATTGIISVVAGTGSYGNTGDGGPATSATLSSPTGVRVDAAGDLYIADLGASVVRFVNSFTGNISTLAGNGVSAHSGDGGVATFASLSNPTDLVLDSSGNLLIADYSNNLIRKVTFVPPTLAFPSTNITLTSAVVPITVNNYGNAALNLSSLSLSTHFQQKASGGTDCYSTLSLGVAATCQVGLVFAPTAAGAIPGTLVVGSNSGNLSSSQAMVNLSGTGLSGTPVATLSAASVTFSSQSVGTTSSAQTITLTNTGTATLPISTIQIAGVNSSDFNVRATTCGSTLSTGAGCTVAITFNPSYSGSRTAALSITDASANSPQTVTLTGTGTGGAIPAFSATSLQFASEIVSVAAPMQSITLSNTGSATLSIFGIALSGQNSSDFTLAASTCGGTLASSAACKVTLSFVPSGGGVRTASLEFALSAGPSPQTISLAGTGLLSGCVTSLTPSTQVSLATGGSSSVAVSAPSGCNWAASSPASWITLGSSSGIGATTLQFTILANTTAQPRTTTLSIGNRSETITQMGIGLRFIPMTPCRLVDTRNPTGAFGGPVLAAGTTRNFVVPDSTCVIPTIAQAYALNMTVVPIGSLGYLNVWPTGQPEPTTSVLNSDGRVKANAAIVSAGTRGGITVYASDATHVIIDISGYFVAATNSAALSFYPITPCRVADTRNAPGPLGQPYIPAFSSRDFPVQASSCAIPSSAQAYSLNFTVIPKRFSLSYLSCWPTGQAQPVISTLNDPTGTVVANAALVQAGTNGDISVYVTDDADVIIDIDGYFAPPQTGGLSLYTMTPCRVLDTRNGADTPLNGTMSLNMLNVSQCPLPPQAQALSTQRLCRRPAWVF